jgi:hypothetical protein
MATTLCPLPFHVYLPSFLPSPPLLSFLIYPLLVQANPKTWPGQLAFIGLQFDIYLLTRTDISTSSLFYLYLFYTTV